ncbi:reverse transcriptase domain-containing protein [Tanacetum coccineum]
MVLGVCDMFKYRETENKAVRLMMFPLSLTCEAKTWLDELNEGTTESWDELHTAFISRFFPPALLDRLLKEIRAFSQHEHETLTGAWLRIKEMLRNCHDHNLTKGNIHQKYFYHDLNETTQEALNVAAGGIFLYKTLNQAFQLLKDKALGYFPILITLARIDGHDHEKRNTVTKKSNLMPNAITAENGMPNYEKFLKELVSNKHKLSSAFLSDESSAIIQNKVPPKLGDPESFLIPCTFGKLFSCNALASLGTSINLMPYSLYAKLSLETLKPTKISVRLVDRSFQYPIRIAENMLVEVGKFTFPMVFVILEMEEDSKVPLIIGKGASYTPARCQ